MIMEWHTLSSAQVFQELMASGKGLTEDEARLRLEKYGPNELKKKKKAGAFSLFINQFRNFLVIILIVAAAFSYAIDQALDGTVIIIIVILNAVFGFVQEYKADKAIEALKRLTSPESVVLRDGKKVKIPSRLLVPGDIVIIEEGTKIPADIRLLEVADLSIDEASLTGESVPVVKSLQPMEKAILAERKNMAFMGTHATYGHGSGIVVSTGMETEIGKIAHMIDETEDEQTPLQARLGTFSRNLGLLILGISIVVIIGGILRSYPANDMILTGIALAVAAIPEGLPAVVTITLAMGLQRLTKRNALMRTLPAVETLGSTTVICSDKTGTLTKNEMTVKKMWYDGQTVGVSGEGYSPEGGFFIGKKKILPDKDLSLLLRIGALCNNATVEKETVFGDPTEGAILVAALKGGERPEHYKRMKEIPFSSERKMMSTINEVEGKDIMFTKGAVEVMLTHCTQILWKGKIQPLTKNKKDDVLKTASDLSSEALRVLAFACKKALTDDEEELIFVGMMGMIDPPRSSVKKDILLCGRAGIKTVMITGDHKNTAVAIAKDIGLFKEGDMVLTGEELDSIGGKDLLRMVEKISVYARVNPSHKVRIVEALKKNKHIVAMTGDGVNDAPALKKADIGIAMGIKGTDVAKEASDMILTDDHFSSIVSAVKEGRGIYDNVNHFILYLLSSNIAEVLIVFVSLLIFFNPNGVDLPLTAIQLLWINLVTDGLPALALGVDPPAKGIMTRKPHDPSEHVINRKSLSFILWVGVLITIGTLWIFSTELQNGLAKAQTMAFSTVVLFELLNVFNSRGFIARESNGIFSNKKLLIAVGLSLLLHLLIVEVPFFQHVFDTVSLSMADFAKIAAIAVSVLIIGFVKDKISQR